MRRTVARSVAADFRSAAAAFRVSGHEAWLRTRRLHEPLRSFSMSQFSSPTSSASSSSHRLGRALLAALFALPAATLAQEYVDPPASALRVPMLPAGAAPANDEGISLPFFLGHTFQMPGGTIPATFQATSNGRFFAAGTFPTADFSPSTAELLGAPGAVICPLWTDLIGVDEVIVDTASVVNTTIITWENVQEYPFSDPFSFQLRLSLDGSIRFVYDRFASAVLDSSPCLVGYAAGPGAVANPQDLSARDGTGPGTGQTVYESFGGSNRFDLTGPRKVSEMRFQRVPGTYVPEFLVPGAAVAARRACAVSAPVGGTRSITFTPVGPNAYSVSPNGTFDTNAANNGIALDTFENEEVTVVLPFNFPFPGGLPANGIRVSDNGWILPIINPLDLPIQPSLSAFRTAATGVIAPFWANLTPAPEDGLVVFGSATKVVITWNAEQLLLRMPCRFQAQLFASGTIVFSYESMSYDTTLTSIGALIGISGGLGVPNIEGESNFSSSSVTFSSESLVYEIFGSSDLVDLAVPAKTPNHGVALLGLNDPVVGGPIDVTVFDPRGTAIGGVYFFGFPAGILASPLGLGFLSPQLASCRVLVDILTPGALFSAPAIAPGMQTTLFNVPNSPVLQGLDGLSASALVLDPTRNPSIFPTDELVFSIGS
jgi:hypothetical protein